MKNLFRSALVCGIFSLVLFVPVSSQAEIMFSNAYVYGSISGITGGAFLSPFPGGETSFNNQPVNEPFGQPWEYSLIGFAPFGRGFGLSASFSSPPAMIYSPFLSVVRPFPEIGTDMQYLYKMGTLQFSALQYQGGTWTWDMNGSYTITSDEPMSRVFVTVFGAPTPSGEAVVQDSGELGGVFSNSGSYGITIQSADIPRDGNWNTFEYGIYAVVPVAVPEPATHAMALAGLACGGFSMWRRRKQA